MHTLSATLYRSLLAALFLWLGACGGGGGGGGSVSGLGTDVGIQEVASEEGVMLSYDDIEPILQAKCIGCHNSGNNPLAPFSLEGFDRVKSFNSAINYAVEADTMPPPDAPALDTNEKAKLIAWTSNQPYTFIRELLRISLVEPKAWDLQSKVQDVFIEHRPEFVECPRDSGWLVEEGALEVRTEFCNYLSLTQQALLELEAGTEMELVLSHSELNFNAPSSAHLALSIGGTVLWERDIDIPSDNALIKETLVLPVNVKPGDAIDIHLHNHGDNSWTFHSLQALVWNDQELTYCPTFDSTFEAIQATVFEQAGCANSLCHGEAKEGNLDLTAANAFDNLVGVPSEGSSLLRVNPRKPSTSYLYHKLSAKTFPGSYDVDGSPMPSAGPGISAGQLEAIRLWIEAGATREGSAGDTLGRGEDELERLLGVCLPEAEAINTTPLPPPDQNKGVQFRMPPHAVPAEKEREICFAVYEDFRDVIPEEYLTESRDHFYVKSSEVREDAFTHHNLIYLSPVGIDQAHDPAFGEWTCVGGDREGETCEPSDRQSCGVGQCRAEIRDSVACRGYGPSSSTSTGGILGLGAGPKREGFYSELPAHGIFYWNSHAFNLTTEDGIHNVWRNFYFADDRRFKAKGINVTRYITAGMGTPPFAKKTECRDYVFDQGDGLLRLSSHTHKRGERFFMSIAGEEIYETFTYDEPLNKSFEPAIVFNSSDPAERTMRWCATWNNGINEDGSPNLEVVTRLSRRPTNASPCYPTACVDGNVGASCAGKDDDASCDSTPGAGDGWCDACVIQPGVSSDDEMFILLGSKLANHDALMNAPGPDAARVSIEQPLAGTVFAAGDTVQMSFEFENFELVPPEDHMHTADQGDHSDTGSDHANVNAGHYHVYLDTDDDSADHLTAWTASAAFELPGDLAPGSHVLRISLRAPDHHALDIGDSVTIEVE